MSVRIRRSCDTEARMGVRLPVSHSLVTFLESRRASSSRPTEVKQGRVISDWAGANPTPPTLGLWGAWIFFICVIVIPISIRYNFK